MGIGCDTPDGTLSVAIRPREKFTDVPPSPRGLSITHIFLMYVLVLRTEMYCLSGCQKHLRKRVSSTNGRSGSLETRS